MAALFTRADRAVRIMRPMAVKMMTSAYFKFMQPAPTRTQIHACLSRETMMAVENALIKPTDSSARVK